MKKAGLKQSSSFNNVSSYYEQFTEYLFIYAKILT